MGELRVPSVCSITTRCITTWDTPSQSRTVTTAKPRKKDLKCSILSIKDLWLPTIFTLTMSIVTTLSWNKATTRTSQKPRLGELVRRTLKAAHSASRYYVERCLQRRTLQQIRQDGFRALCRT